MTVAFGMMGADPTVADAKYVLSWILRGTQTDFTRRDAWLEMRRHFTGVNDLEAALTLLVQYNYIREARYAWKTRPTSHENIRNEPANLRSKYSNYSKSPRTRQF